MRTKYFNSLDVWKVEPARANASDRGGRSNGNGRDNYGGGRGAPRADEAPPLAYDPRPSDSGNRSPDTDDIPF